MKVWLLENNFKTEELFEYVNYCCRDDYGLGIDYVSAWAGIHYFAARKHENKNYTDTVLTWAEGNARLVQHLTRNIDAKNIAKNQLVYDVQIHKNGVKVLTFNEKENKSAEIWAQKIIVATPQYINKYLIPNRKQQIQNFEYAPWFTATLTLHDLPDNQSFPLSWDNVIYKGKGLGYIYNQHQNLEQIVPTKVITYYYSFSSEKAKEDRKKLFKNTTEYWKNFIIEDLKIAHPTIEDYIETIEIHKIGHGMISPKPNFIKSNELKIASKNIEQKIFFAHTDLVGISIFEEAFHQGINIVNTLLNDNTTLDI
jgi:hypothetical protein